MALDEALLEIAESDHAAWLRFYTWREPTLSLGYFQPHADRQLHRASANCPMVRRSSGGGAILHDRELTYSIVLPQSHPLARRAELLYQAMHATLIETLAELGIVATLCDGSPLVANSTPATTEPFLCFERHLHGDLLVGPHKVAGSAQRRHRGAVLQHGSVILARSKFAPELPGLADLAGHEISVDPLQEVWQKRLAKRGRVRSADRRAFGEPALQGCRNLSPQILLPPMEVSPLVVRFSGVARRDFCLLRNPSTGHPRCAEMGKETLIFRLKRYPFRIQPTTQVGRFNLKGPACHKEIRSQN